LGRRFLLEVPRILYWTAVRIAEWRTGPVVSWYELDERVRLVSVPTLHAKYAIDADAVVATAWWTAKFVQSYPPSKGRQHYLIQDIESWGVSEQEILQTWKYPMRKAFVGRWMYDLALCIGLSEIELMHVPNALDHALYHVTRPIDRRPARIAMLWHTDERKGSRDGIRALGMVRNRYPEVTAVLFGVGGRPEDLPEWIEYHRRPALDVLVNEIYNGSAIYLCSSLSEGWGLPGAEAMACGCALVSTDNGGVRDYAVDGQTALLVPPGDAEAMAEGILKLLRDAQGRAAMARRGAEMIRRFTWDGSADLLEQWLNTALAGDVS
jgi:glycosyltransferase involved in cell wall biosynthesis